jgi:hypothetical protein
MKRIFPALLLPLVLCIATEVHAQSVKKRRLSTHDKAEIVRIAMEMKLKLEEPLKFSEYSVFRSGEMTPELLPRIPGFQYRLLSPAAIRRKAQTRKGIMFLDVGFSQGEEATGFQLYMSSRSGGKTRRAHVYRYLFSKVGDRWQGQITLITC